MPLEKISYLIYLRAEGCAFAYEGEPHHDALYIPVEADYTELKEVVGKVMSSVIVLPTPGMEKSIKIIERLIESFKDQVNTGWNSFTEGRGLEVSMWRSNEQLKKDRENS